ncbi:hypothetical protein B6V76_08295 [Thioclava sp. IC9]|nr:hypothetical protein B6V76_08295 [Thioclava sp. IC9]
MTALLILVILATGCIGCIFWFKRQKRSHLLNTALPEPQRVIVQQQVPLIRKLPPDLQDRLEGKISLLLDQVDFIGCDGLDVTDEMRLSIAAQACLLIVNSPSWYDHLRTILIYPGAFKSRQAQRNGYVLTERETIRTGESWARGPVVLSWTHAQRGAFNDHDGHNVVFHEFAHQLDDLSGRTDGIPALEKDQSFSGWVTVFAEAYKHHVQQVSHGRRTVIDTYGAEGPEEFFAVLVEVFFERPVELKHAEPALYDQLTTYFRLDPTTWA